MIIYLASSPTNNELNELIAAAVEDRGHDCCFPGRAAVRDGCGRWQADAEAIADADLVLLVGPEVDTSAAWKAGYARALGKHIVLLCPLFDTVCDHFHLADEVLRIQTLDDIDPLVGAILRSVEAGRASLADPRWSSRPCAGGQWSAFS